jgi:nucleoside-diphosphate-sugar epimerase
MTSSAMRASPASRGSRVVVTGASGFIGSQLEAYLATAGHEVVEADASS